jgi:enoyl-CoA hydratase/carnithine racemase
MADQDLLFSNKEGIATITLNRPPRKNAFTLEMIDQLVDTLEKWRKDPEVKVIVLTGAGDDFAAASICGPPWI